MFHYVKEFSIGSLGKRLKGRAVVGEHMGWVRKHREDWGVKIGERVIGQNGLCFE